MVHDRGKLSDVPGPLPVIVHAVHQVFRTDGLLFGFAVADEVDVRTDRLIRRGERGGEVVEQLKREVREGDLVVTMGAGNVWEIGRDLVG